VLVGIAPVAYVKHQRLPILSAAERLGVHRLVQLFGDSFLAGALDQINNALGLGCMVMRLGCTLAIDLISGESEHVNKTRLPVYSKMFPAGTSTKNVAHWVNNIRSGSFGKFDYGSAKENMRHYGSPRPPQYNLGNLRVPTALFSGGQDLLADREDVAHLLREIRPGTVFMFKEIPSYGHIDFLIAQDAHLLVYPDVLRAIASKHPP